MRHARCAGERNHVTAEVLLLAHAARAAPTGSELTVVSQVHRSASRYLEFRSEFGQSGHTCAFRDALDDRIRALEHAAFRNTARYCDQIGQTVETHSNERESLWQKLKKKLDNHLSR